MSREQRVETIMRMIIESRIEGFDGATEPIRLGAFDRADCELGQLGLSLEEGKKRFCRITEASKIFRAKHDPGLR